MLDSVMVSLAVLSIGLICLALGLFTLWKNPFLKVSQLFLVAMCLVTIVTSCAFLLINVEDQQVANVAGRLGSFSAIMVSALFFLLTLYLPYEIPEAWPIQRQNLFVSGVVVVAAITSLLPGEFIPGGQGFWTTASIESAIWLIIIGGMGAMAVINLNRTCTLTEDHRLKMECTILTVGVLMPVVISSLQAFLSWSGVPLPRLTPIGLLVSSLIFARAIGSLELFNTPPIKGEVEEEGSGQTTKVSLASGHCDLIMGKRADDTYEMFLAEVKGGSRGLLVTRIHPDQLRERYGLIEVPIMWLSSQPGQNRLDPTALTIIQHTMTDFIQKEEGSIVMLDGLDYLISENQLDKVLRMIYAVHDAVVVSGSKFIVPMDPLTLETRDLAFIEREFVVISEPIVRRPETA